MACLTYFGTIQDGWTGEGIDIWVACILGVEEVWWVA
jgi:hypothetical protein